MTKALTIYLALITLAALTGCGEPEEELEVKSIYFLQDVDSVEYVEEGEVVSDLSIAEIKELMLRASWKSGDPINKGGHLLRIQNNPRVLVSYYGGFFWVQDRTGYFQIQEKDKAAFEAFWNAYMTEYVFPWRKEKYNL